MMDFACIPLGANQSVFHINQGFEGIFNANNMTTENQLAANRYGIFHQENDTLDILKFNAPFKNMTLNRQLSNRKDSGVLNAKRFLRSKLVPAICLFGILGNLLTLLVLTRKRIKSSCDGTERTVHIGLISLAVSDLLVCVCLMPYGMFSTTEKFDYRSIDFSLIYVTYSSAPVNTLILTSTWLTVNMAASRYIAIVHPFKARHLVGMTGTVVSIIIVVLGCITFNIPYLFEQQIGEMPCADGTFRYIKHSGKLHHWPRLRTSFIWMYFTIGICLPLMTLSFCNICLVKALWSSAKLRKRYRVPAAHIDSNYRITSILVTIVVMYILLVSPAEIVRFLRDRLIENDTVPTFSLAIAIEITNVLQTINFSFNFVLYFILNVHFRHAMKDIFCACASSKNKAPANPKVKKTFCSGRTSEISKQGETSQTLVNESSDMKIKNILPCKITDLSKHGEKSQILVSESVDVNFKFTIPITVKEMSKRGKVNITRV